VLAAAGAVLLVAALSGVVLAERLDRPSRAALPDFKDPPPVPLLSPAQARAAKPGTALGAFAQWWTANQGGALRQALDELAHPALRRALPEAELAQVVSAALRGYRGLQPRVKSVTQRGDRALVVLTLRRPYRTRRATVGLRRAGARWLVVYDSHLFDAALRSALTRSAAGLERLNPER